MELVVEFWPNNYMALYHAGASQYQLGQFERAKVNVTAFTGVYTAADGWTSTSTHSA